MSESKLTIHIAVAREPSIWGSGATDEQASRAAEHHAEALRKWAVGKWPSARVSCSVHETTAKAESRMIVTGTLSDVELSGIMDEIEDRASATWADDFEAANAD